MTIKNLGDAAKDHQVKIVNLFKGEQYEEWYKKINPQSAVPVLNDDGFILNESRAIAAYLVNSRANGSSLYPTDAKKRAIVDARLYFEATMLFPVGFKFFVSEVWNFVVLYLNYFLSSQISTFVHGNTDTTEFKQSINKAFGFLNQYLTGNKWVAGDDLTIADFFICTIVSSILALKFPLTEYPEIERWYEQCRTLPGFAEDEEGAKKFGEAMFSKLSADQLSWS